MSEYFRIPTTGAFGDPIDENPSGVMMEAGYRSVGLDWRYQLFQVPAEGLEDGLKGIRAMGFAGLNLTIPHKIAAIPYMKGLSKSAELIGAINVVVVKEDGLYGENTDGKGFVSGMEANGISLKGKRIVLLGSGGAARAICVECALAGAAEITIVCRTMAKGEELADLIWEKTACIAKAQLWTSGVLLPECDILINATNIGLYPDTNVPDICYDCIKENMIVQDIIPNPAETPFLKKAKELGARTLDGQSMLVHQGALGVELWTGRKPDIEAMKKALREAF